MALNCPRCNDVELDEIELGDVLIDRCPRCAGLWFDHNEIGEITTMRTKLQTLESAIPPSDLSEDHARCPRCEGVFLRRASSGTSPTDNLLRCASCMGTWMDRGVLSKFEDDKLIEILKAFAADLP